MKYLRKFSFMIPLLHAFSAQASVPITNLAPGCTALHSLFLKSDGSLWAMGWNIYGQLGDGTYGTAQSNYSINRPEETVFGGVTAVVAGGGHSLILKSDGSLWATGWNQFGQLGDGTFNNANQPEEIVPGGVMAIAAGEEHSLFVKTDGSLWGMGNNLYGQLGTGTFSSTNQPVEIVASGVTAVAAGYLHSLFLMSDGSVWAMGWNESGQLGDGTYGDPGTDYSTNQPEEVMPGGIIAIAAGFSHSLFLASDGSLWATGDNSNGQLGDGTFNNTDQPEEIFDGDVTAIAAGGGHSLFLTSDGSLWAMGLNESGQLGDGTLNNANQPEQIVNGGVSAIAAGLYHSLFLKTDGSLWAMGNDESGQLGDGFAEDAGTATPEQIAPSPPPVLTLTVSGTDLQFTAPCGFGGNFYLLATPDLTQPLIQWSPIRTSAITSRTNNIFSATLINAVNAAPQQYYILQSE